MEGVIRPRLNEIFSIVKLELERAGVLTRVPSGIVLTGGGALTIGIEDSAKKTLALPVRVADPQGVGGLIDDIIDPRFSSAIGLILYGAHPSRLGGSDSGFSKKVRLPNAGNMFSKLIETVKDLLP